MLIKKHILKELSTQKSDFPREMELAEAHT